MTGGSAVTLEELGKSEFVVGLKETKRAVENGIASCVFVASDCDERFSAKLKAKCAENGIPVVESFSKKEMGETCGIKVKAAAAAVLKAR